MWSAERLHWQKQSSRSEGGQTTPTILLRAWRNFCKPFRRSLLFKAVGCTAFCYTVVLNCYLYVLVFLLNRRANEWDEHLKGIVGQRLFCGQWFIHVCTMFISWRISDSGILDDRHRQNTKPLCTQPLSPDLLQSSQWGFRNPFPSISPAVYPRCLL